MSDYPISAHAQSQTVYIYGLRERFNCNIRYIGKTIRLRARLRDHCNDRTFCHRVNWIQSVLKRQGVIEIVVLQKVPMWANWQDCERMWIRFGMDSGWNLTNSTTGGDGVPDLPPEAREKMRQTWIGRKHTPESIKKIGDASRGRKHTEKYKQYMRDIMKVRVFSKEHRERLSIAAKDQAKKRTFSNEQIVAIRERLASGEKSKDLASEFNVNKRTICRIKSGIIYGGSWNVAPKEPAV